MTTLAQLKSPAYRQHTLDQALAFLRDNGPMTTAEIAEALPPWEWENRHGYQWANRVSPDWLRLILYSAHRKGLVDRTPKDSSSPVLWWLADQESE